MLSYVGDENAFDETKNVKEVFTPNLNKEF